MRSPSSWLQRRQQRGGIPLSSPTHSRQGERNQPKPCVIELCLSRELESTRAWLVPVCTPEGLARAQRTSPGHCWSQCHWAASHRASLSGNPKGAVWSCGSDRCSAISLCNATEDVCRLRDGYCTHTAAAYPPFRDQVETQSQLTPP